MPCARSKPLAPRANPPSTYPHPKNNNKQIMGEVMPASSRLRAVFSLVFFFTGVLLACHGQRAAAGIARAGR